MNQETRKNLNPNTPVFHMVTASDDVVPFPIGVQTAEFLQIRWWTENGLKSYRGPAIFSWPQNWTI